MSEETIPVFCQPCIQRLRAHCPHLHSELQGSWHFHSGEVWDDIHEVCLACGQDLDLLPLSTVHSDSNAPIFFKGVQHA